MTSNSGFKLLRMTNLYNKRKKSPLTHLIRRHLIFVRGRLKNHGSRRGTRPKEKLFVWQWWNSGDLQEHRQDDTCWQMSFRICIIFWLWASRPFVSSETVKYWTFFVYNELIIGGISSESVNLINDTTWGHLQFRTEPNKNSAARVFFSIIYFHGSDK